ncbi:uncharacterized protein LOC143179653 [Calliopsis andreniformis]|uniref:uncharacterized protein LOC143179653 n=1 Tax=Calliopsis andreniformis TaxID=337506 RepID=UPI003FCD828C
MFSIFVICALCWCDGNLNPERLEKGLLKYLFYTEIVLHNFGLLNKKSFVAQEEFVFFQILDQNIFPIQGLSTFRADLDILLEDGDCAYINEEYIDPETCGFEVNENSEYETYLSTNMDILKKLPENTKIRGNINGIEMGEYTIDMGLHVEMKLCDVANDPNTIAVPMAKAVGFTPEKCPPEPGKYANSNFMIKNQNGLPESFPIGQYLLNVTLLTEKETIVVIHIYLTVI